MKKSCFLLFCLGFLLLPLLSVHSQTTKENVKETSMKSNRFLISFDGNFQHFKPNFETTIQKERMAATFGYFLNEKTMLGLGIQFSQEDDFLNIVNNFGFGARTNQINKRKFQPFVRRYVYRKNNFNIFSDLSFNVASEAFTQSIDYYGVPNNPNPSENFDYMTIGAHLGIGLEYNLNEKWVAFGFWEALRYQRELNVEESNSNNIVLDDLVNMSVFKDVRVGLGYYF